MPSWRVHGQRAWSSSTRNHGKGWRGWFAFSTRSLTMGYWSNLRRHCREAT